MKTIEIPDDLDVLDCPVQEKIALSAIRQHPFIGNRELSARLGLSDSGVRALLRRFKKEEWVRETKRKGSRHLEVLVGRLATQPGEPEAETRQIVTENAIAEMRQEVAGQPPTGLTSEQLMDWTFDRYVETIQSVHRTALHKNKVDMAGYWASEWTKMIDAIKADAVLPVVARDYLVSIVERRRNYYAAIDFADKHAPKAQKAEMVHAVERAAPDQLSKFYERLRGNKIGSGKDALLLTLTSTPHKP